MDVAGPGSVAVDERILRRRAVTLHKQEPLRSNSRLSPVADVRMNDGAGFHSNWIYSLP